MNKSSGRNSVPYRILNLLNLIHRKILQIYLISHLHLVSFNHYLKQKRCYQFSKKIQRFNDYQNYHFISIISIIKTILKKLMYKRIYQFSAENETIYGLQSGFRQNFSTVQALINLMENIRQALSKSIMKLLWKNFIIMVFVMSQMTGLNLISLISNSMFLYIVMTQVSLVKNCGVLQGSV